MKSYPFIIERYTHPIVTLETAKQWLNMDIVGYEGQDDLIIEWIESAVSWIEHKCNFSLGISTYEWNTNCLPREISDVPYIQSISSIEYRPVDSIIYNTVSPTNYQLIRIGERKSIIQWTDNYSIDSSFIRIRFKAGFAENEVPKGLLRAVRALIGEESENRLDGVSEKRSLSDKIIDQYLIPYAG